MKNKSKILLFLFLLLTGFLTSGSFVFADTDEILIDTNTANTSSLNDSTKYYLMGYPGSPITIESSSSLCRQYVIKDATITKIGFGSYTSGTVASTEYATVELIINNNTTTPISLSTTYQVSPSTGVRYGYQQYELSQSVNEGDYLCFRLTTPVYNINPGTITFFANYELSEDIVSSGSATSSSVSIESYTFSYFFAIVIFFIGYLVFRYV